MIHGCDSPWTGGAQELVGSSARQWPLTTKIKLSDGSARAGIWCAQLWGQEGWDILRDGETTIEIQFSVFEGGALGGREENRAKCCFFFFVGNATIKF